MKSAACPYVRDNLASTRHDAAAFLDNLKDINDAAARETWVARWINIGDSHHLLAGLNVEKEKYNEATEAWLCALTAFEVARRLLEDDHPQLNDLSAKVEASIHKFGIALKLGVERMLISCSDQPEFPAYYLPARRPDICAPAILCISREGETGATLLARLLPAVIGCGVSVLVVSHDDVSNHWRGQSAMLLSCCLDRLSLRTDVDASRIGVYGEGLSAALANELAVSDHRVAAAVCDGGLWNLASAMASVGWLTKSAQPLNQDGMSALRSRLVRRLRCPVLVVAGGRGFVSVSEAIALRADCTAAHVDLEIAMSPMIQTAAGEIENFLTSDDCISAWLARKLRITQPHSHYQPMPMGTFSAPTAGPYKMPKLSF